MFLMPMVHLPSFSWWQICSITCLFADFTGCLMRWTRSGGPSSRSVERLSVLISTTECASSSNSLVWSISNASGCMGYWRTDSGMPVEGMVWC